MRKLIIPAAMWLSGWYLLSLFSLAPAYAEKIPALSDVPAELSGSSREQLNLRKQALEQDLAAFQAAAAVFNGKTAEDQSDSEYQALEAWRTRYIDAAKAFNKAVAEALAAERKPTTIKGKGFAWDDKEYPERSAWSDELRRAIKPNLRVLETAADISNYAPNYATLPESQRLDVWVSLFAAIANYESPGFKTDARYVEKKIRDKQGNLVAPFPSVGLLMLSYKEGEQRAYGYEPLDEKAKSLEDPLVNLRCGVKVLTYWVKRDGVIAGGSEQAPRGGARYWSVLREGTGHHLKEIQDMVKKQALGGAP